jgi:formylglycine-generating enzyme required for sulfatase activity
MKKKAEARREEEKSKFREALRQKKAGLVFKDCEECPEMVIVPAGSTFTQPFALGKTEVTQGEWKSIMGNNPSYIPGCGDNCPVEKVSWNDVKVFIQRLSSKTGKQYRLPSEAEWEYACSAGGQHEYCGSDRVDDVAWYSGNSGRTTHPVGSKQPNAYGLYDMSGNVWEWVEDCYDGNCARRVLRGGSWSDAPQGTRAAYRDWGVPAVRNVDGGFRLARMLP